MDGFTRGDSVYLLRSSNICCTFLLISNAPYPSFQILGGATLHLPTPAPRVPQTPQTPDRHVSWLNLYQEQSAAGHPPITVECMAQGMHVPDLRDIRFRNTDNFQAGFIHQCADQWEQIVKDDGLGPTVLQWV